jgi:hypothetical protein
VGALYATSAFGGKMFTEQNFYLEKDQKSELERATGVVGSLYRSELALRCTPLSLQDQLTPISQERDALWQTLSGEYPNYQHEIVLFRSKLVSAYQMSKSSPGFRPSSLFWYIDEGGKRAANAAVETGYLLRDILNIRLLCQEEQKMLTQVVGFPIEFKSGAENIFANVLTMNACASTTSSTVIRAVLSGNLALSCFNDEK